MKKKVDEIKQNEYSTILSICMKLLFSIFFFCVMTLPCFAQDSLKTASTLSFKPLVGLGLLNGARAGLQVQYNDFIAIEGGVGILIFLLSQLYFSEVTRGFSI
ncbi:MAG: hypothetical protein ACK5C0_08610 [Candidatus Kapaibacterium sp.]|jgi:hypothetical protein